MMIKGVFFDLGGTLYSYNRLGELTLPLISQLSERLELEADISQVLGHYREASKQADRHFADQPFYLFRDYFEAIYGNFVSLVNKPNNPQDFRWFDDLQQSVLLNGLELKPDCHNTLDRLKAKNLYLSVVSNSDTDMLDYLISRAQLQNWLHHWTSSESAQSCKPDARFFELALEKSGLSADQVLFVGDSLEQDILGAHQAGMTTVLISESDESAPMHIGRETVDPDYKISQLSSLLEIIENG